MIVDNLKDVVRNTHGLGFIDTVKIIGSVNETKLEAMSINKTVVMYGSLKKSIPGLDDTVGLSRMSVLSGMLNFPPYSGDDAEVSIKKQERNGEEIPAEIVFSSSTGHKSSYRFMARDTVDEVLKVPPFRGVVWDIVIQPTKQAMKDLQYFSAVLGSYESNFLVKVTDGVLEFHIGTGATSDRTVVPFAKDVKSTLRNNWSWPLPEVLAILKNADSGKCTMSISSQGALMIELDTGLIEVQYILPAKSA